MWRAGASPPSPRTHCAHPHRHLSLLSALVWVDFASMLPVVLLMRGAEKSKKSCNISRVTLSPMESGFLFCGAQSAAARSAINCRRFPVLPT